MYYFNKGIGTKGSFFKAYCGFVDDAPIIFVIIIMTLNVLKFQGGLVGICLLGSPKIK